MVRPVLAILVQRGDALRWLLLNFPRAEAEVVKAWTQKAVRKLLPRFSAPSYGEGDGIHRKR